MQFHDVLNVLIRFSYFHSGSLHFMLFCSPNIWKKKIICLRKTSKKNPKFIIFFIIVVCPPLILTLLLGLANNRSDKTRVICLTLFYDFFFFMETFGICLKIFCSYSRFLKRCLLLC